MTLALLSDRSYVFERAEPGLVSHYVNQHVGPHRIALSRRPPTGSSLRHRKFSSLDLCRIRYGANVRVTSVALEDIYHVQVVLNGRCRSFSRGEARDVLPGDMLLINPDDPVDLRYSNDCDKFVLKLPTGLVDQAARERGLRPIDGGIRFLTQQHRLHALGGLLELLGLICHEAEAEPGLVSLQQHYAHIIASKLLSVVPHNAVSGGPPSDHFDRIVEFIDRHLTQDIQVAQLAAQAHLSVRSLYTLFQRHAGVSPMAYVRQRKLERVHERLSNPGAAARSVTDVALEHGFFHLGRFARHYRQHFGELPSETFQRRG